MYNNSIKLTPVKALIGCDVKSPAEAPLLRDLRDEMEQLDLTELREQISKNITEGQKRQKECYDRGRREAPKYKDGELVLVRITSEQATGESRKLSPKFRRPFRIQRVLHNDRYEVEDLRERHKRMRTVVSVDHIKAWITIQGEREN